jgi:hypothetical protein
LTGWVHEPDEATHAVTITRGVPGVETVVNRLDVRLAGSEDRRKSTTIPAPHSPADAGKDKQVGTGVAGRATRPRARRHADPKPELEDRWLSKEQAIREAAATRGKRRAPAEREESAEGRPHGRFADLAAAAYRRPTT